MSALLQRAIEKRANDWSLLNDLRAAIAAGGGAPTAEQSAEWDRIEGEITRATSTIDAEQRAIELEKRLSAPNVDAHLAGGQAAGGGENDAEKREAEYRRVFQQYARFGVEGLSSDERRILQGRSQETRALSEGTNTAGGYTVPTDYWVRITEVMKAYGGLQGVANQVTTSDGRVLPWPKNDDTGNQGSWLGENTQVSALDLSFTQNNLQAWTANSGLVLVSLQLLQDTAFDLDSWIPKKLGQRLGRVLATGFMSGSGSSQPTGLVSAVTQTVTGGTGVSGAFTYNNLVDVQHKVDPAYRANGRCRWMMSDLGVSALLKITDQYGHPLWQPTISQTSPDFLLGFPLTIDQATPAPALSARSVMFGDFESAYVVRTVAGGTMMRLTERYADYLQVGFFGFVRVDGKPDDLNAVSVFVGGAT